MIEHISEIIIGLSGVITTVVSWMLGRKKTKADLNTQELSYTRELVALYQDMITDLKKRYDAEIIELRSRQEIMKKDLEECRKNHKPQNP